MLVVLEMKIMIAPLTPKATMKRKMVRMKLKKIKKIVVYYSEKM
jgi:hypothetical protein